MLKTECTHFTTQADGAMQPQASQCQVCGLNGPLRMCAACGFVGCCESMNSHDTEHWQETGHAVIVRMPLNDASWVWCYEHQEYLKDA